MTKPSLKAVGFTTVIKRSWFHKRKRKWPDSLVVKKPSGRETSGACHIHAFTCISFLEVARSVGQTLTHLFGLLKQLGYVAQNVAEFLSIGRVTT